MCFFWGMHERFLKLPNFSGTYACSYMDQKGMLQWQTYVPYDVIFSSSQIAQDMLDRKGSANNSFHLLEEKSSQIRLLILTSINVLYARKIQQKIFIVH